MNIANRAEDMPDAEIMGQRGSLARIRRPRAKDADSRRELPVAATMARRQRIEMTQPSVALRFSLFLMMPLATGGRDTARRCHATIFSPRILNAGYWYARR